MSDRDHYIELHRQLHTQSTLHFTGKSLRKYIEQIDSLIAEHNCGTILDYGCGKAQFWPAQWQGKIQGYDPAWEKFNKEPVECYRLTFKWETKKEIGFTPFLSSPEEVFQ